MLCDTWVQLKRWITSVHWQNQCRILEWLFRSVRIEFILRYVPLLRKRREIVIFYLSSFFIIRTCFTWVTWPSNHVHTVLNVHWTMWTMTNIFYFFIHITFFVFEIPTLKMWGILERTMNIYLQFWTFIVALYCSWPIVYLKGPKYKHNN